MPLNSQTSTFTQPSGKPIPETSLAEADLLGQSETEMCYRSLEEIRNWAAARLPMIPLNEIIACTGENYDEDDDSCRCVNVMNAESDFSTAANSVTVYDRWMGRHLSHILTECVVDWARLIGENGNDEDLEELRKALDLNSSILASAIDSTPW